MPSATAWARVVAAVLVGTVLTLFVTSSTEAQNSGILFPAPAGSEWGVLAGYNTATHNGIDPYALDLWRVDAETGGTPLLSPIDGEVGYVSSDCISVRTSAVNLLLCHVLPLAGLERGDPVSAGQPLGTVAPDGMANNNGIAHIHLQLNVRNGDWGSSGAPLPFAGPYAIEGQDFEAATTHNAHFGRRIVSTNGSAGGVPVAGAQAPSVDAWPDRLAAPGIVVTLSAAAAHATSLAWVQTAGPPVIVGTATGEALTFHTPANIGSSLDFRVTASGPGGSATDTVRITVAQPVVQPAPSAEPAPQSQPQAIRGTLLTGEVVPGVNLVIFGGGTQEELITAIGCDQPTLTLWASPPEGGLIRFAPPPTPAFVNAEWFALFPGAIPEMTPLIVRCV